MKSCKAIVAIARKLLVVIWHVMTERVADRKADPDMVAFKLMTWSWKLNDLQRGGLTARQFVRYCLMQLQLGENLTMSGALARDPSLRLRKFWRCDLNSDPRQKI